MEIEMKAQKEIGKMKYIRLMQHDLEDNIRIGMAMPLMGDTDEWLDMAEESAIGSYENRHSWCGGFEKACGLYYRRVALVDAETLEILRLIYPKKNR